MKQPTPGESAQMGPNRYIYEIRHQWAVVREVLHPTSRMFVWGLLCMVVSRVSGLLIPYCYKFLIDWVIVNHEYRKLYTLVPLFISAAAIDSITSYFHVKMSVPAERLISELRTRIRQHVARLPIAFFDSCPTGILVQRMMSDVDGVHTLVNADIFEFAGCAITMVLALALLCRLDVSMAVIASCILLCYASGFSRYFNSIGSLYGSLQQTRASVASRLTESLNGIRVVRSYNADVQEATVFDKGVGRMLRATTDLISGQSRMDAFAVALGGTLNLVMLLLGTWRITQHQITLGGFFSFMWIVGLLDWPIRQTVSVGSGLAQTFASLKRTQELLREPTEAYGSARAILAQDLKGAIEFDHVYFGYAGCGAVLKDVSFHCAPGTVTAIVGHSGAGKSTITKLLCAFYTPTRGQIRVDGIDLSTIDLYSYRKHLGVVLQDTFLFDGTIRDNVVYSRPNATKDEFYQACKDARVDEFVRSLSEGYDAMVGENGIKLSGGQKQRISIARAMLARPRLLILDEAMAGLDAESEVLVEEALAALARTCTTIIIAHKLNSIKTCDQVLVMDNGTLVESGSPIDLYSCRGHYFRLYSHQV
jgi:ABC-type multidrug transport system fused ATPase/permease subunit